MGSQPCGVAYSRAVQLLGADLEPKQAHRLVRTDLTERRQLDRYVIRRGCAASHGEGERQVEQLQPRNRLQSPQSDRWGEEEGEGEAHTCTHTWHVSNSDCSETEQS